MSDLRYTEAHEWVRLDGTVGISTYAQKQLGDVVFVDPPAVGTALTQGDQAGVVESVKAASEIYAPVAGEVVEANAALDDEPGLVNSDATGEGWIYKLKLADAAELDELMDEAKYSEYLSRLD